MTTFVDKLKSRVGLETGPRVYEIERGLVQRFVQSVGDTNHRWEEELPPTFIPVIGSEESLLQSLVPLEGTLHGSTELECYRSVRIGDRITVRDKLASVREMGKMVFMTFERTYQNQRQEPVARCRQMLIRQGTT